MSPTTLNRSPKPAQREADRLRRQVATERADRALRGMLADMPDRELAFEAIRALIRGASRIGKRLAGEGRAAGVLCGALVDVSPGYRQEPRLAAEAMFKRSEGDS